MTFVNPIASKTLGRPMNELIGQSGHADHHHTHADGMPYSQKDCKIYAAFRTGLVSHVDSEIFWRADGSSFPVEYTSTPIHDENGQLTGAVVVFTDITERKAIEEDKRNYLVEKTRTQLQSFVVSALPVFASGTTSQTRNMLASKFAQNFEDNVMPEFKQEMDDLNKSVQGTKTTTQTDNLSQYLSWLQHLFTNLGAQPNIASDGLRGHIEFSKCHWSNNRDINPVFCLICRAMVLRSFIWTNLNGKVDHSDTIADGSSICRFDIVLNKGEM